MRASHSRPTLRFWIKVKPHARRAAISRDSSGAIQISVTAPALDGAANAAVIELVSRWLGVPKRDVQIVSGMTSRNKVLTVHGLETLPPIP